MSKHVMECVELDDGGSRVCLGCRQYVYGSLTETPPGECPTPYKSPKQLLTESVAREAALREELETSRIAHHETAKVADALKQRLDSESGAVLCLQERLTAAAQWNTELVSAVRSINRGKYHEVLVPGDDEPQYRQRKEWVDWVLGICDEVSATTPNEQGAVALAPMVERMSGEQAGLTFKYQHPLTKENRSVSLTKAEVAAGMEDTLYEKLVAQFCQCESVGETNVVDCNCDEYIHDFELVADDAEAEQPVSDPVNEFDARFLRSIDSGNGQPGAFSHNSRPSAFNHENYGACGQTPRVYGGYQTSDNRPMSHDFTKARDFNAASAPTPGRAYSDWANKCESAPVTVVGDEPSSRDYPHGESFYRNKDAD